MRDTPRPRRAVSPRTLRLLRPLFRFSSARDAYVLRIGGGQYGPVLIDRPHAPGAMPQPAASEPMSPTGRFQRADGSDVADGPQEPTTKTRQR